MEREIASAGGQPTTERQSVFEAETSAHGKTLNIKWPNPPFNSQAHQNRQLEPCPLQSVADCVE